MPRAGECAALQTPRGEGSSLVRTNSIDCVKHPFDVGDYHDCIANNYLTARPRRAGVSGGDFDPVGHDAGFLQPCSRTRRYSDYEELEETENTEGTVLITEENKENEESEQGRFTSSFSLFPSVPHFFEGSEFWRIRLRLRGFFAALQSL
jgi:hypothetical protein